MKILIPLIMVCSLTACKAGPERPTKNTQTADLQTSEATQTANVPGKEGKVVIFVASGFEPMWHLELSATTDSIYLVTYTNINGEMTGRLKKVTAHAFAGTVQNGTKKEPFKLEIRDKPCMHEDGMNKDPLTATITFENNTSSGCGKFLNPK